MTEEASFRDLNLNSIVKKQICGCLNLLRDIFGDDLLALYLYGSYIMGGLQKYSDIDLFAVINRASTSQEKGKLTIALLDLSWFYMKSDKAPIEMTIVEKSQVNPWSYPPTFDFQYGEWLRDPFQQGKYEPWESKEMPDLAILITQILLASKTLAGPEPHHLLCKVPYEDFISALKDALPLLISDIESDTRNMVLTLARIWCTVTTDILCSKTSAADWAMQRLPKNNHSVMKRAKAICEGNEEDYWEDIKELITPCTEFMVDRINATINEIMLSGVEHREIKLI